MSALTEAGKAPWRWPPLAWSVPLHDGLAPPLVPHATLRSGTLARVSSTRSLLAPLRRMSWERSRRVGRASRASGRSSRKYGRSFLATGLDSSTSGARSSRVARRLTKVVLARRMKSGRRWIASASALCWAPIAPVAVARFCTRAARSVLRELMSVTRSADWRMNWRSCGLS